MPVAYCGCTVGGDIVPKSAATKKEILRQNGNLVKQTWFSANAGANAQDEMYGPGMRLHNSGGKKDGGMVCTVCGRRRG